MNTHYHDLQPKQVWENFARLNAVPRPSKKEEKVIAFMVAFGQKLGLETITDSIGNVIIRKPATKGYEHATPVILQSHLDMVCQKNNDTEFDFLTQGIQMYVEDGWVKAKGTTLGADNGMGVAAIMSILESNTIAHPPLEALFTIDEETGMTGALGLQGGLLQGKILLNLDTEEDDEIDIGCAGGIDVSATTTYAQESVPAGFQAIEIVLRGLRGGHSGMDIHKGLGNANKLMNRLLFALYEKYGIGIASIVGGGLRNAIPRESKAVIVFASAQKEELLQHLATVADAIQKEFAFTEPLLEITFQPSTASQQMNQVFVGKMLRTLYTAHNGVYAMTPSIPDLVQTSNNIASVEAHDGVFSVKCLTRSSVESSKMDLACALKSAFELMGCEVTLSGSYPGWQPNTNSPILQLLTSKYQELFQHQPRVVACHAGLECGILGTHYPDMDMISFGPTILGAHSPDERVSVASVEKFWKFLLAILADIK